LKDPEATVNDKFVALELLKNANIASNFILPGCQDTGTAIIMGKRGQYVITDGEDEMHLSHGVFDTYLNKNLRYVLTSESYDYLFFYVTFNISDILKWHH